MDCLGCLVGEGGEKVVGWFGGKGSIADIGKSEPFSPLLPPRSGVQYVQFAYCEKGTYVLRRPRGSRLLKDGGDTLDHTLHNRMEHTF